MIAETRGKLIAAARKAFGEVGFAAASMDDFTAEAGLTRGALYHHFGDKKGLLEAVIKEIDADMGARLAEISGAADDPWEGFVAECVAYVEMALEPEIQRILLLDGPAVLGDPSTWPNHSGCIASLTRSLQRLLDEGRIANIDAEAMARLLNGAMLAASLWIANSADQEETSRRAVDALRAVLDGLLKSKRSG